jgi:hypothetical protein
VFGVWSVFPALGSEKLWQFLEAPETKQNNYSFVFFPCVVVQFSLWNSGSK